MADKTTDVKKAPAEKKTAPKKTPAVKKTAAEKKAPVKKTEPVIKTILQIDGKEFDLSTLGTVAADVLKKYKSVHKRKVVEEFVVYLKPEDNAAYFTVNGEGRDDFKVDVEF